MLGGVRMMWPGMAPLVSGMPGRRPGEAGMPIYFRARSSIPAKLCTCEAIKGRNADTSTTVRRKSQAASHSRRPHTSI